LRRYTPYFLRSFPTQSGRRSCCLRRCHGFPGSLRALRSQALGKWNSANSKERRKRRKEPPKARERIPRLPDQSGETSEQGPFRSRTVPLPRTRVEGRYVSGFDRGNGDLVSQIGLFSADICPCTRTPWAVVRSTLFDALAKPAGVSS
jgi:hypothetical protein